VVIRRIFSLASVLFLSTSLYSPAQAQEISVGQGSAKVGALLQFWAVNDSTAESYQYRIRRAEFKLSGSVIEQTRYFLMIDPAKALRTGAISATNDNKVLQDLGVGFTLFDGLELVVGQFKTPTTPEGLESSSELLLPERSYVARVFGDRREPGVMLTFKKEIFKASVMSSNGRGTNVDDSTESNEKDLHGRFEVAATDNLAVGAFTSAGDSGYHNRGRWGLNLRGTFGPLLLRLDGVRARDADIWSTGYVGDVAYTLNERLQAVVRYDSLDNGTFVATGTSCGLNYFVAKHNAKIQAAYVLLSNMDGSSGVGSTGSYVPGNGTDGSVFVMNFQMAL